MNEVADIYNNLFRYESRAKSSSYPIHKKLKFEDNRTLLDFILDKVQFNVREYVLDVGCGTGHTLFYLHQSYDIFGTGLSISNDEVEFARKEVDRLELKDQIKIKLDNFDNDLSENYNKIICIESLKHSQNLMSTIENFIMNLSNGGTLIIADDFFVEQNTSSRKHTELWQVHAINELKNLLNINQFFDGIEIDSYNLSQYVPTKANWLLYLLILIIQLAIFLSYGRRKRNLKTYLGALLLEQLYRKKFVEYYVLIINKS